MFADCAQFIMAATNRRYRMTTVKRISVDQFKDLMANPHPHYAHLREGSPVHCIEDPNRLTTWVVARYEEAATALADRRFSRDFHHLDRALRDAGLFDDDPEAPGLKPSMLSSDPPAHSRLRRLVSAAFTARRVEQLRRRVQQIANELIDGIAPLGSMDLIEAFAFPLPAIVIFELLGVPAEDRDDFRAWTTAAIVAPALDAEARARGREAMGAMHHYIEQLVASRRSEMRVGRPPEEQPDLTAALIAARDNEDGLDDHELVGM